jgi:hypothetical protein
MSGRRRPSSLAVAGLVAIFVIAACGRGGSIATPTATPVGIVHSTGATDLVLRFDEGGGFVAPGFLVTEAPAFSLYGDGTAIFRDPSGAPPAQVGSVSPGVPFQTVRLTEGQVQELLGFAIGPGGLGIARAQYQLPVADAPTATFTLITGGLTKTVSVNGLGIGAQAGADADILAQLGVLKARLVTFGGEAVGEQPWSPGRYRGILTEGGSNSPTVWPWPGIAPSDFVQHNGPTDPRFPIRTMTPAEVAALGVSGLEGGAQGFTIKGPDEVTYEFRLRPLLPDEQY